jgi:hypothetical protein
MSKLASWGYGAQWWEFSGAKWSGSARGSYPVVLGNRYDSLGASNDELPLGSATHGEGSSLVVLWSRRRVGQHHGLRWSFLTRRWSSGGLASSGDGSGLRRIWRWVFLVFQGVVEGDYIGASSIRAAQWLQTDPISNLHQQSRIFGWIRKRGEISIGFNLGSIQGRVRRGSDLGRGPQPRAVRCNMEVAPRWWKAMNSRSDWVVLPMPG